jgi:hypothetical protein
MRSSTSSSDPRRWRRFFALIAGSAAGGVALIWLFVALVDPFDALPLSPDLDRPPIATNARFSFPALARSERFDSAVFGTSTSRLLRPVVLNPLFGARFVNLAMNAATAYEQSRLLGVFLRAHPAPKVVIVGLDDIRCLARSAERYTPRPFPEWMYDADRWRGYRELLNLYTVQQAGIQLVTLLGLKREVYGRDGYTSFVPPDSAYDRARVALHLRQAAAAMADVPAKAPARLLPYPAIDLLGEDLRAIPAATRVVLFFSPFNHVLQPRGGALREEWDECKRRVAAIAAAHPHATVADFMIPSPITEDDDNYWDAVHYRVGIGDRVARDLAAAARGEPSPEGDYALLSRPVASR